MKCILQYCLTLCLLGCSSPSVSVKNQSNVLRIKGSDSMLLLVQQWAAEYMKRNKNVSMYVDGGGSGIGIKALIEGLIDIATSSRPMTSEEVQQMVSRYQSLGVSVLGAKDALGIVVHPSNRVSNLSLDEAKKIFSGKTVNWKEVGGIDTPIVLYSREPNSGSYVYFEEHVMLGESYAANCHEIAGARALIDAVARDSFAIGYSTFVYAQQLKMLSINGYSLTAENVQNGTYPISRYLYFYTLYPPEGITKNFFDWVVSKEGQRIAQENGYIPLFVAE